MAGITWTRESELWLKDIYDYISEDNPRAASDVVDGIFQRAQDLVRFPRLGYRYVEIPDREVRILLYGHYRIAYLLQENDRVDILGVFHGALDIERYLI